MKKYFKDYLNHLLYIDCCYSLLTHLFICTLRHIHETQLNQNLVNARHIFTLYHSNQFLLIKSCMYKSLKLWIYYLTPQFSTLISLYKNSTIDIDELEGTGRVCTHLVQSSLFKRLG